MKKILLSLFLFSLLSVFYSEVSAYDQEFPSVRLRYGYQYNFFDIFHSAPTKRSGIAGVTTTFTEASNFNGGANPNFPFTSSLVSAGYILNAGQSMTIVQSSFPYAISYHPLSRSLRNIEIVYAITYYEETSPGVWAGPYTHTEYQPYEITWCGDGVRDRYTDQYSGVNINEQCDPNDPAQSGWGTGGCSTTCTPITIPTPPTCSNLSVNPTTGTAPLASNVFCTGTNASSYSINCGNGQVINANNGTCNYLTAGSFTAVCTVNGTTTSPSCRVPVTVGTAPICGNGVVEGTEQCDDGNTNNTDACSNTCTTNVVNPICGNGVVEGTEQCDDGNTNNNDSCRNDCTLPLIVEPTFCGDGVQQTPNSDGVNEQCDDGNNINTDACSNTCTTNTTPACIIDGIRQAGEQCDPNDSTRSGWGTNGCSSTCNPIPGGSSTGPACTRIQVATTTLVAPTRSTSITCSGNSQSQRFRIDCGNGQEVVGNGSLVVGQPGMHFTGTCNYSGSSTGTLFTPRCFAGDSTGTPSNGSLACTDRVTLTDSTDSSCTSGCSDGGSYCGDGVLQRPNSNGQMEQCERLINGGFPSWCNSSSCTVDFTTDPTECVIGSCPITIPSEGQILFGPTEQVVIGNGMNPFLEISVFPYAYNDSSYPMFLDDLCVTSMQGNTLTGDDTQCRSLGVISPGERVQFSALPNYIGNIANIPLGQSYGENILGITVRNEGELYDWAYFTQRFNVRVARPSVATTGGGTSFLAEAITTNKLSDISNIALGLTGFEEEDNKNFVGTSVSDLGSYSKDNLTSSIKAQIEADGLRFVEDVNSSLAISSTVTTGASSTTTLISDFGPYNGIENVFVLNGKNFKLGSSDLTGLSGPRTYIINNGNLEIEANVTYDDNIAFVVKGGNIIIDNAVSAVSGTYISIPVSGVGGDIKGTTGTTNTVLTVDGSLYGDISDLSGKRTYIRDTGSQISVGTIVSFASGIFRKSAPLVSQFIEEYMESEKIAK